MYMDCIPLALYLHRRRSYMMFLPFLLIAGLVSVRLSVCSTFDVRECQRFDYEYKLLERILLLEHKAAKSERKQSVLERKNEELVEALRQIRKRDNASATTKQELLQTIAEVRVESSKRNNEQDKAIEIMKTSMITQIEEAISEAKTNETRARDELKSELKNELNRSKQEISGRAEGLFLAFTARLTNAQRWSVGTTMKYDDILTNDGNMYDPSTGIFTVPTSGRYLISITVTSYGKSTVMLGLMKNGAEIARVEADDQDPRGDQDTGAVTIVVDLNKGNSLFVKIYMGESIDGSGYTLYGTKYNTFTAVLLKAGEP